MRIRFCAMAWGWGVDDFFEFSLPSLLQPDNLPWLVHNGYEIIFSVYTVDRDVPRITAHLERLFSALDAPAGALSVHIKAVELNGGEPNSREIKRLAFRFECEQAVEEGVPMMIITADVFYGNGSLRNIAVYCRKPGIVAAAPYMRVKREPFADVLAEYRRAFGDRPVGNAALVDMSMRTMIDAFSLLNVDQDRNTSYRASASMRTIAPDLHVIVLHFPGPFMFWPNESDLHFFEVYLGGNYDMLDKLWTMKLVAERRWRLLASRDLFFVAELNNPMVEQAHVYPLEDGRLYNETFWLEFSNTHMHEMTVVTLRREHYLAPPPAALAR